MSNFTYTVLTIEDQRALMTERLQQLEASHFRVVTELRLAALHDPGSEPDANVMLGMASIEVQAVALREWIAATHAPEPKVPAKEERA